MTFEIIVCIAYAGLGMGLLAWGQSLCRKQFAFNKTAQMATGTVTEILTTRMKESTSRGGSRWTTYFAPVVEFRPEGGAVVTHRCDTYVYPNRYAIGMPIEIRYNPANPQEAQLNSTVVEWLRPVAVSIFGTISFVGGTIGAIGYFG